MRIVGPSSLGVVSMSCGLNATVTGQAFEPGAIAVASQSLGMGIAVAAEAWRRHAGISSFVSMGDKVDVSGNDLLRLWADDAATNVVLLQLESFGDPVRFARVARAVSRRKPVIALTTCGAAGRRDDPALLTPERPVDQLVDALLTHTGVIRVSSLEEMIDVGVLLERHPAPAGCRVAVIGDTGDLLIPTSGAAIAQGLDVAVLSSRVQDEITRLVPNVASTGNPVDLGSTVTADRLAAVVGAVSGSGEVDACIVVSVDIDGSRPIAASTSTISAMSMVGIPVALTLIGGGDSEACAVPMFPTPERAARALALAAGQAEWVAMIAADETEDTMGLDASSFVEARRLAQRHAGGMTDITWLTIDDAFELLASAGLSIAPCMYARSAEECAGAADRIGFPCVVKADVTDVQHKSGAGAVELGVRDSAAAREHYAHFVVRFGNRLRGVVVQAQQETALELLAGITRDPKFGPHVAIGGGGVEAELRGDRVVLVAPMTRPAARRAVESLRLAPLFHGFHGRAEVPVEPFVDLVHRLGILAATVPEISCLEMNPVLVGPHGCVAVDAVVGLAIPPFAVAPVRGLRATGRRTHP